jgi:hypothetical protein
MARPSRSRKRQPEFDPSELEDLILVPAVGTGVGSHLIASPQAPDSVSGEFPGGGSAQFSNVDLTTVAVLPQSTVVPTNPPRTETAPGDQSAGNMPTVVMLELSTVGPKATVGASRLDISPQALATATAESNMSTEVMPDLSTVDELTTVDVFAAAAPKPEPDQSTVVRLDRTPVVRSPDLLPQAESVPRSPIANLALWATEAGELVPASRVKRIRFAQDVLNSAEEAVYDTLWAAKPGSRGPHEGDANRVAQAGYDFLMKRTRLSKKTIQRIVDRLIDKGFIEIHEPADIYRRTSTVYRVYSYRSVLDRQSAQGRAYVAKIGPGFVYVYPFQGTTHIPADGAVNVSTVVESIRSTVVTSVPSTGVNHATPTVDQEYPTTVAAPATLKERQIQQDSSTACEALELREMLHAEIGPIDDGAVRQLLSACRSRAGDCTPTEIAYFVRVKLKWVRNLQNPVGFILTAVPRHFENGGHLSIREILRQESAEKARQWRETYDYWKALADDPAQPAAERAEAQRVIGSLEALQGTRPDRRVPPKNA